MVERREEGARKTVMGTTNQRYAKGVPENHIQKLFSEAYCRFFSRSFYHSENENMRDKIYARGRSRKGTNIQVLESSPSKSSKTLIPATPDVIKVVLDSNKKYRKF